MPQLDESINKYEVLEDKKYVESDYYLTPYVTPDIVKAELQSFFNRPIPEEIDIYESISPQTAIFELFSFDMTKYKYEHQKAEWARGHEERKAEARKKFDLAKAMGKITPISKEFEFHEEFAPLAIYIDPSGQSNTEWMALPFAKILAMGATDNETNDQNIKVGDIVRIPDDWVWKAENPAYEWYINHPEKNIKGAVQTTKPPMRWIYNFATANGRLSGKAININPLNHKNCGFTYSCFITEFKGVLSKEKLLKRVW